jgi:hypothetical protein
MPSRRHCSTAYRDGGQPRFGMLDGRVISRTLIGAFCAGLCNLAAVAAPPTATLSAFDRYVAAVEHRIRSETCWSYVIAHEIEPLGGLLTTGWACSSGSPNESYWPPASKQATNGRPVHATGNERTAGFPRY